MVAVRANAIHRGFGRARGIEAASASSLGCRRLLDHSHSASGRGRELGASPCVRPLGRRRGALTPSSAATDSTGLHEALEHNQLVPRSACPPRSH